MHRLSQDGEVQLSHRVEAVDLMRDSGRATPADPSCVGRKSSKSDLRSKKNGHLYFNEAFAVREEGKKVPASAGVWVEMKTNVILENEFEFIKSLSQVIAKRYSRTEETVALSVEHSSCMIMGGTFDGCYFLTITSLSSISPTCNKRNVALISEWLNTNLGVPSSRGYIRFVEPDSAGYAMGGATCLDLLERERPSTRMSDGLSPVRTKKSFFGGRTSRMGTLDENRPPSTDTVVASDSSLGSGRSSPFSNYPTKRTIRKGRSMFNLFGLSQRIQA